MFANTIGVRLCLAVNGGTRAIMASLVALGIQPGAKIIVPGYTYIATMSAVITIGKCRYLYLRRHTRGKGSVDVYLGPEGSRAAEAFVRQPSHTFRFS